MSAIELEGVGRTFGSVVALEDVDLAVGDGELVTILGPSGSGKSTLLNLIAGLTEPTSGRISIDRRDVTRLPSAQRNVGLVFQSYALFPNMTVFGNVAFALEVRRVGRMEIERRVGEALRMVRLEGLEHRRPAELSGGQQQRVALARAIVFEPSILLLDEPLAALDRKLREEVRVELRRLQRALGVTTILVTHDQDEALSLSDWLVVLDGGRIQQIGPPDDTYLRPANRFVAEFLGIANLFQGTVSESSGERSLRLDDGLGVPIGGSGPDPGWRGCALVRPERMIVEDAGGATGIAATVQESIYHGQQVRYHLRLDGGKEVIAAAPDPVPRFTSGETVRLHWRPEDVWFIPSDAESSGRA